MDQVIPLKEQKRFLSKSIWALFLLEVACVLLYFSIVFYVVDKNLPGLEGLIYVYASMIPIGLFIILNIVGLFIYPREINKYKELSQKPPILLNILRLLSLIVSIISSVPILLLLASIISSLK
jgi:magnesium-transporting ATPase (P-type)